MDFHSHSFRAVDGKKIVASHPASVSLVSTGRAPKEPYDLSTFSRSSKVSHADGIFDRLRIPDGIAAVCSIAFRKGISWDVSGDPNLLLTMTDTGSRVHRAVRKSFVRALFISPHHAPSSRVDSNIRVICREVPTTRAGTLSFSSGVRYPIQIRTGGGRSDMPIATHHRIRSTGYMKERK